ncbi:hypothetical protein CIB84_017212, partial [Bambusicola thoracicus]
AAVLRRQAGEDGLEELELAVARARGEADLVAIGVGQGPGSGPVSHVALHAAGAVQHGPATQLLPLAHLAGDKGGRRQQEEERDKDQGDDQRGGEGAVVVACGRALPRQRSVPGAGDEEHAERGGGRQRGPPVVPHQHDELLLRSVPLARRPPQPHLPALGTHGKQPRLRGPQQLVRKPRVLTRVGVHGHHFAHQVPRGGPGGHQLAGRRAAVLRAGVQHQRRVVVLVHHQQADADAAAEGRGARVGSAHHHLQLPQLLVVQRTQHKHASALRLHRHTRARLFFCRTGWHHRVAHLAVGPRVRIRRLHGPHQQRRCVVLMHVHGVRRLVEDGGVVIHIGDVHAEGVAAAEGRRACICCRHNHRVLCSLLPVQRAHGHQLVVVLEGWPEGEGELFFQGTADLPVHTGILIPDSKECDHCPRWYVLREWAVEGTDHDLRCIIIHIHYQHYHIAHG